MLSFYIFKYVINYVDGLINKPDFLSELKWFRGHLENVSTDERFPTKGLPLPKDNKEHSDNSATYDYIYDEKSEDYYNIDEYNERELAFRKKYELDIFGDAFEFLLFYGSIEPMKTMGYCSVYEVLDLDTTLSTEDELFGSYESIHKSLKHFSKTTPIAILIHPYMSKRDIIDAVRKTYDTAIKPIQDKYKNSDVGLRNVRQKSKKLKERDDFIYQNRGLHIKELTSLVNERFRDGEHYDYTYIQSILKKEKEKRI